MKKVNERRQFGISNQQALPLDDVRWLNSQGYRHLSELSSGIPYIADIAYY